jgi:cysteine-rich repeat protein
VAPATTVCRAAADVCDAAENCDGTAVACPADAVAPATTVCRVAADLCDVAENCDGTAVACPADAVAPATTVCRVAADLCDVVENCDGTAVACPVDAVAPATTVCRVAADLCDVAENCDGTAVACPADAVAPATTVCRAAADVCDVAENCDGTAVACPADAVEPATTVCRAAADVCDVAENCDGTAVACPADAVEPVTTVCRAAADVCDAAETCDGTAVACPADAVEPVTTECRASTDPCDPAENCDGTTVACPADVQLPDLSVCDDADACTITDQCLTGICVGDPMTCGDGVLQGGCGETCDDGNLIDNDGCDSNCTATGCGNGIRAGLEQCDDGNLVDGDGCSSMCLRELQNPVPEAGAQMGRSVAVIGTNVIAGVPLHSEVSAIHTGRAFLFSGVTGALLRTFSNPTPGPGDEFGFVVAAVGTKVVIGAPFDDTAGPDAGAAYVFNTATGTLVTTLLNPVPAETRHFGWSAAAVGNSILIGAPGDAVGAVPPSGGAAYLFDATTGALTKVFLNPNPAGSPDAVEFGFSVSSVNGDIIVGAPGHDLPAAGFDPARPNAGAVYVFDATLATVKKTLMLPAPKTDDRFGHVVKALGSTLLVGVPFRDATFIDSGAAYQIDTTSGAVLQTFANPFPSTDDEFGYSVASAGAGRVVISAPLEDTGAINAGAAYLFDGATMLQVFQKAAPVASDEFGRSVSAGGSVIAVGAHLDDTLDVDAGAVYLFTDLSCGDGALTAGETCDDGNTIDGDGCDSNCTPTGCGNGVMTAGEACDDGNLTAGDGCSPTCGLEGACGDGVQAPFEQCDDGNLIDGDGCDSNCTLTGCGNGVRTAPETCDQGALNGTDLCCSATCQIIDSDSDTICDEDDVCPTVADLDQKNTDGDIFGDACDLCPGDTDNDSDNDGYCTGTTFNPPALGGDDPCSRANGGNWQKPKFYLARLEAPLGDEKMRLKGTFTIGSHVPVLKPDVYGVHIRVTNVNRELVIDEKIPGGVFDGTKGWKSTGEPPSKWIYRDKTNPPIQNGIKKILLKDLSRFGANQVSIVVGAKKGTYFITENLSPVRVTVELNDTAVPPGSTPGRDQCGEVQFKRESEGLPACEFRAGRKLKCK